MREGTVALQSHSRHRASAMETVTIRVVGPGEARALQNGENTTKVSPTSAQTSIRAVIGLPRKLHYL